ncbi:hypothetical protein RB195_006166 [Necator americanus]|uniref:Uncharacterized protein n=1 Tax=Necator americanus TaxID=51031 RepID=A0ABR1BV21_NECAM
MLGCTVDVAVIAEKTGSGGRFAAAYSVRNRFWDTVPEKMSKVMPCDFECNPSTSGSRIGVLVTMAAKVFGIVSKRFDRRVSLPSFELSAEVGEKSGIPNMPVYQQSSTRRLAFGSTAFDSASKPQKDFYNNNTLIVLNADSVAPGGCFHWLEADVLLLVSDLQVVDVALGTCDSRGVGEVGVLVNTSMAKNIDSFEQLMTLIGRLRTRRCGPTSALTIFAAYTRTSSYEEEEVETFYMEMEKFYREDHAFYKITHGDFNAKIGTRRSLREFPSGPHPTME